MSAESQREKNTSVKVAMESKMQKEKRIKYIADRG